MNDLKSRLKAPIIVAPMFLVSNPEMTLAICGEGLVGSFPAHSTRTRDVLSDWLVQMDEGIAALEREKGADQVAPYAVNIVCHKMNERMEGDIELVLKHKVPIVITSKSSPGELVDKVHAYGGIVMSDIAIKKHAQKVADANVDAAILVCAGAGGHNGSLNPFAFMSEVKSVYHGPTVLAGGMTTGRDVFAAEVMGADFAYIGTRFINVEESLASNALKQMIIDSQGDDILTTSAIGGIQTALLIPSLKNAGVDIEKIRYAPPGAVEDLSGNKQWKDVWSAGQGVGNITDCPPTAELCRRLIEEYQNAKAEYKSKS